MENAIGIDVGATKTFAARVDKTGNISKSLLFLTPKQKAAAIAAILNAAESLADSSTCAVGIGVPGPVDFGRQIVRTLPNLSGWRDVKLAEIMKKKTGLQAIVDNDAKCFLLAELKLGAAKGKMNVLGIVIGTGIGGAIAVDGKIYRGANNFAGEAGHMQILPPRRSGSKNPGSFESYASGGAVGERAREYLSTDLGAIKTSLTSSSSDAKAVFERAKAGDRLAKIIVDETADCIGIGIANLVSILDPELIVVGGSLSDSLGMMLPRIRRVIRERCFPPANSVPIVRHKVRHAGAVGAALLALDARRKPARTLPVKK